MDKNASSINAQKLVEDYFSYVAELRAGKDGAVDRLMELWDADGIFEFAGAPPVTGTFRGQNAIRVLYQNRLKANGMPLRLEVEGKRVASDAEVALGVVATEVNRSRALSDKIVAGWTTTVGTSREQGFQVSGAHTFTFKDGKIQSLKVVVSPRAEAAGALDLGQLTVDDIGRLALAAWCVV